MLNKVSDLVMEGLRFRKDQNVDGKIKYFPLSGSVVTRRTPFRIFLLALYLTTGISSLIIFLVTLNTLGPFRGVSHSAGLLDSLSAAVGVQERVYAVIIDAGSTGSRVLAFTFLKASDNSLRLEDQLWHEDKPGLSSYADNPSQGAESMVPLLQLAYSRIPAHARAATPLVLKATAGLRLLPPSKAQSLLDHTRELLQKSDFKTDEKCVEIMDGKDEGIFSWFTLNFLMNRVGSSSLESLVALDLGGGSTQVTFVPTDQQTLETSDPTQLSSITVLGEEVELFTHSYLGMGLMAARKAILLHGQADHGDGELLRSPCLNPVVKTSWLYGGVSYNLTGPAKASYRRVSGKDGRPDDDVPVADYEECFGAALAVVTKAVKNVPDELRKRDAVAFSYFVDRAMEQGLIDSQNGGTVRVSELRDAAEVACGAPNADQPFACLDLTFIATFLQHGYRFHPTKELMLYKKIAGYDLSWALGLAFNIITTSS